MIQARSLSFSYGERKVLKNLDVQIEKGEFVALLGPNGAGKSTLLRALSGLTASPAVSYKGRSMTAYSRRELSQQIAFVSQSLSLTFPLTGWEFVAMARYSRMGKLGTGEAAHKNVIENAMRATDTLGFADRYVSELSGGEWQRLRVAQALAQEPDWLFLDEPTAHLDVGVQLDLMELLARLNRDNQLTVVVTLHDINLALAYSRRVLLLQKGVIRLDVETGACAENPALDEVFEVIFKRLPIDAGTAVIARKIESHSCD